MNPFSQHLESLVSAKKANISQMASFCGIDRSSMYKIIRGTRKPGSSGLVRQLSRFLKLSPKESDTLMEKYMILQIGPENFLRRRRILSFIRKCFAASPASQAVSFEKIFSATPRENMSSYVFYGTGNIINAFGYIAQREMERKNGLLSIRMQPDQRFVELLATLGRCTRLAEGFRTEHIIALAGSGTGEDSSFLNLKLLQDALPACKGLPFYNILYYYTNVYSGRTPFSFLPGTVITQSHVLQISGDCQFAILHTQPETIDFFKKLFAQLRDACQKLTWNVRDHRDLLYASKRRFAGHGPISFQMFPRLSYFMTEDLLRKYLPLDLDEREFFIHAGLELSSRNIDALKISSVSVLISESGIRRFLETGIMPEFPSDTYMPPSPPDRLVLMERYLDAIINHIVSFRLIKEILANTSSDTSIWIEDSCAYFLFKDDAEDRKYMVLQDPDLIASLRDFILHMEADLCYDEKQSLQILQDILDEYRNNIEYKEQKGSG